MTEVTKGLGQLNGIVIDVKDLDRSESFWSVILGAPVVFKDSGYAVFGRQNEGSPLVGLQKVAEAKSSKNRVHVDIKVPDVEAAAEKIVSAGGSRVRKFDDEGYIVMADPDGNEFCLLPGGE